MINTPADRSLYLDLSGLSNLRTIHIQSTYKFGSPEGWIRGLVLSIRSRNLIRIQIDLELNRFLAGPRFWTALDDPLCLTRDDSPVSFPQLREVKFRLAPPKGMEKHCGRGILASESVKMQLPKLNAKGLLVVELVPVLQM